MSIHTFYRVCIWLPILVAAVLLLVARGMNLHLASGPLLGEFLVYSLLHGGIPYAVVAAVATIWVGRQREEWR